MQMIFRTHFLTKREKMGKNAKIGITTISLEKNSNLQKILKKQREIDSI